MQQTKEISMTTSSIISITTPNYKGDVKIIVTESSDIKEIEDDAGTGIHAYIFTPSRTIPDNINYKVQVEGFYDGSVQDAEFEINFIKLPSFGKMLAFYKNWKNDLNIVGESNEHRFILDIFYKSVVNSL